MSELATAERKLSLCRHCGSTATAMQNPETNRWWIECDNCGVSTPTDNFGDPYKIWNARPSGTYEKNNLIKQKENLVMNYESGEKRCVGCSELYTPSEEYDGNTCSVCASTQLRLSQRLSGEAIELAKGAIRQTATMRRQGGTDEETALLCRLLKEFDSLVTSEIITHFAPRLTTAGTDKAEIPTGLTWGENRNREPGQVHIEWHAPCGCAFHPQPFPHIHPCTNEHKRPDLHTLTEESERERVLRRRRAIMPDYDKRLEDWLS